MKLFNGKTAESASNEDEFANTGEVFEMGPDNESNHSTGSTVGSQTHELHKNLQSRHIALISLGGAIGTGLFIGSGAQLASCGPAGFVTAYFIMGTVVYSVMNAVGEMVCFLPNVGGAIAALTQRYADESLAFAVGWNYYYCYAMLIATEVTAAGIVVEYWITKVNIAVWITIFLVIVVALNFLAVQFYGEAEFWFASLKIICLTGLIITCIVIFFGGAPTHDRLGFRYWQRPGAWREHLAHGNTARFLDVWTGIIKSGLAFILGPELVALACAEAAHTRRNVKRSSRRYIWRLLFFYLTGAICISVTVAYNNERLLNAISSNNSTAAASPYVIAIQEAGIPVLNHIVNAAILSSAWSAANSFLYASSRTLFTLAKVGHAPRVFKITNRHGVPYYAVALSACFGLLAYLNVSKSSGQVFTWLSNISTISGFMGWITIGITYIRWHKAVTYHGLWDRVPFKNFGQPYTTYYFTIFIFLVSITNGYEVFFHWKTADFFAAYITIPVYVVLFVGHKLWSKSKFIPIADVDVKTGLDEVEEEAARDLYLEKQRLAQGSAYNRFMNWLF